MKKLKRYKTSLIFLVALASIAASLLMDPGAEGAARCRPGALSPGASAHGKVAARDEIRVGEVESVSGPVVIRAPKTGACRLAHRGAGVLMGEMVQTLAGSRCRLVLMAGEVVYLASGTLFQVDEFNLDPQRGKRHSLFSVYSGAALFYLPGLLDYSNARAAVRTPTSIAMARATKFALAVFEEDSPGGEAVPAVRVLATSLSGEIEVKHRQTGVRVGVGEGFTSVSDRGMIKPASPSDPDYLKRLLKSTLGFKPLGPFSTTTIVAQIK